LKKNTVDGRNPANQLIEIKTLGKLLMVRILNNGCVPSTLPLGRHCRASKPGHAAAMLERTTLQQGDGRMDMSYTLKSYDFVSGHP